MLRATAFAVFSFVPLLSAAPTAVAAETRPAEAAPAAGIAALCGRLAVPEGYELVCETRVTAGARAEQATVRPESGPASTLAQLTLRPLERESEPLAWTEPNRWLEERVAVDVSGIGAALRPLAGGEGPLGHPAAQAMIDGLLATLAGWGRLPLQGCVGPEEEAATATTAHRRELRCRWGVPPLALSMNLRLVEDGDRRYAVSYWAADEQRLQHLEAIANSFGAG